MIREEVYKIIDKERTYQDYIWGGKKHDEAHTVGDFLIYMDHYLNKAKLFYATTAQSNIPALDQVRKIAALAVAAGEVFGFPPRILTSDGIGKNINND